MATQRYSVTPHPINPLLSWVKGGLPASLLDGEPLDYDACLAEHRRLRAETIRRWVEVV
jgi:hypothetical protein